MNTEQMADAIVGIYIDETTEGTPELRGEAALDLMSDCTVSQLQMIVLELAERLVEFV